MNPKSKQALLAIPCFLLFRGLTLALMGHENGPMEILGELALTALPVTAVMAFFCARLPDGLRWRVFSLVAMPAVAGLSIYSARQYAVDPDLLKDYANAAVYPMLTSMAAGVGTLIASTLLLRVIPQPRATEKQRRDPR